MNENLINVLFLVSVFLCVLIVITILVDLCIYNYTTFFVLMFVCLCDCLITLCSNTLFVLFIDFCLIPYTNSKLINWSV